MAAQKLYVNPPSERVELKVLVKGAKAVALGTVVVTNEKLPYTAAEAFGDDLPRGEHVIQPYVVLGIEMGSAGKTV